MDQRARRLPEEVVRVAAIDQGTNTTRLLVADVEDGRPEEVVRRSEITRLGEGVDERRRLLPLPIARVRNVLTDYRREAERLGAERILLVATSAVRDAENGEAFLGEIEWSYGFSTRLLSGDDEAELMLRGVGPIEPGTLVLDIGGGSTELVTPDSSTSIDVGSGRLTERLLHADPPTRDELDAAAQQVRSLLPRLEVSRAVGVAGTITTLAALDLGLEEYDAARVDGHRITNDGLERQLQRLAALPLAERREVPALEPDRAPVIVAGALIAREVVAAYGLDAITVSVHDILDGIALAAAELPEPVEGDAPPGAYTCC
jgi:exopolyphosphatase / guanosine-5'-triphosphate,3'-diphosphate pyrophosphatase